MMEDRLATRLGFENGPKTEIKTLLEDEDSTKRRREVKSNAFRFRWNEPCQRLTNRSLQRNMSFRYTIFQIVRAVY